MLGVLFSSPLEKNSFYAETMIVSQKVVKIRTLISIYPGNSLSFVLCSQGREGARKYKTREALVEGWVWLDPAIPGPIPDGSLVLTPPLAQSAPGRRAWGCPVCLGTEENNIWKHLEACPPHTFSGNSLPNRHSFLRPWKLSVLSYPFHSRNGIKYHSGWWKAVISTMASFCSFP